MLRTVQSEPSKSAYEILEGVNYTTYNKTPLYAARH